MSIPVTQHFSVGEFDCHDGMPYPVGAIDESGKTWLESRLKPLCDTLEAIRSAGGNVPIAIDSGYRTPAYDQKLYDVSPHDGTVAPPTSSQHPQGRAADIRHPTLRPLALFSLILGLYQDGQLPMLGGLGLYPTFVHVDVRKRPGTVGGANDGHLAIWGGKRPSNIA